MKVFRSGLQFYQRRITVFHYNAVVVGGNAILVTPSSAMIHGFYARQNAAADNDQFKHTIALEAGTYSLMTIAFKTTASGKLLINLEDIKKGTNVSGDFVDFYVSPNTANVIDTITGISVPHDGLYNIYGTVSGHTSPSSGYQINLASIDLWRTD